MARTYRIYLRPEPEGGYTATVPTLPGCISFGATLEEAQACVREAIELYVEQLEAEGEEVPDDSHTLEQAVILV